MRTKDLITALENAAAALAWTNDPAEKAAFAALTKITNGETDLERTPGLPEDIGKVITALAGHLGEAVAALNER